MLSVESALARILAQATVLPAEPAPLDRCLGRVCAEAVRATTDVPPFANSSMDGYAVRAADLPASLAVAGEIAAGTTGPRLEPGTALRIMTGAPLPRGADAVVPLERSAEADGRVRVADAVDVGAWVRRAGEDTRAGDVVVDAGTEIGPATVAVLASCGVESVAVRVRPRVAILSTGDELVAPGRPLPPGAIYDANGPALRAAVREAGGEPLVLPRAADRPDAIEAALREGAERADLIIVSGGVSVGRHDHVRAAIERLGTLELWRVAVQPGKPLAFGRVGGRPVLGLPGNPVSALVTFELFARPLLRAMLGLAGDGRIRLPAVLDEEIGKDAARRAYLRVVVRRTAGGLRARAAGGQSSGQLRPLAAANALLVVPEGEPVARSGSRYDAILTGALA